MRLNKIFAAAALAVIASLAFGQPQVRVILSAYDVNGTAGGVLDPSNPTGIYRMYLRFEPVGGWINQNPDPGYFSTISFSIRINPTLVDIGVPTSSGITWLSTFTSGYSTIMRLTPGVATGVVGGQTFDAGGGLKDLVFSIGATGNDNELPMENPFQSRFAGDRNIYVKVNGPAIQALGGAYRPTFGRSDAQIAIKVNPRNETRSFESDFYFLVPEPASMIALGSGLVGLLALRRRKK